MDSTRSDSPQRLINICPQCAIEHFATCQPGKQQTSDSWIVNVKQVCGVPGEVTLLQLLMMVYRAVACATCTITSVTYCLMRLAQYLLMLLVFVVENCAWVCKESRMQYTALKSVAALVSILFLLYIAFILLTTIGQPMLYLLYSLLKHGYSFI